MCYNNPHTVRSVLPAIPADPFIPAGPKTTEKD